MIRRTLFAFAGLLLLTAPSKAQQILSQPVYPYHGQVQSQPVYPYYQPPAYYPPPQYYQPPPVYYGATGHPFAQGLPYDYFGRPPLQYTPYHIPRWWK